MPYIISVPFLYSSVSCVSVSLSSLASLGTHTIPIPLYSESRGVIPLSVQTVGCDCLLSLSCCLSVYSCIAVYLSCSLNITVRLSILLFVSVALSIICFFVYPLCVSIDEWIHSTLSVYPPICPFINPSLSN